MKIKNLFSKIKIKNLFSKIKNEKLNIFCNFLFISFLILACADDLLINAICLLPLLALVYISNNYNLD